MPENPICLTFLYDTPLPFLPENTGWFDLTGTSDRILTKFWASSGKMSAAVFLVPMTLIALLPLTGKMDVILVNAILVAAWSVMLFTHFPGSYGSFMQKGGTDFWVFTISNSMALVISATIICVHLAFGVTVEVATWRKIKACTQKALIVALFCFAVASHQVILTVIGNQPMVRLNVTSLFMAIMGSTLVLVLFLMYRYPKKNIPEVPRMDK